MPSGPLSPRTPSTPGSHRGHGGLPLLSLAAQAAPLTLPQREKPKEKRVLAQITKARLNVQPKARHSQLPASVIQALLWGGSARSWDKRPVTRCLLPPLLLALSQVQLFDQVVIALAHVRGAGHQ